MIARSTKNQEGRPRGRPFCFSANDWGASVPLAIASNRDGCAPVMLSNREQPGRLRSSHDSAIASNRDGCAPVMLSNREQPGRLRSSHAQQSQATGTVAPQSCSVITSNRDGCAPVMLGNREQPGRLRSCHAQPYGVFTLVSWCASASHLPLRFTQRLLTHVAGIG